MHTDDHPIRHLSGPLEIRLDALLVDVRHLGGAAGGQGKAVSAVGIGQQRKFEALFFDDRNGLGGGFIRVGAGYHHLRVPLPPEGQGSQ